jgi:hypothetical protein
MKTIAGNKAALEPELLGALVDLPGRSKRAGCDTHRHMKGRQQAPQHRAELLVSGPDAVLDMCVKDGTAPIIGTPMTFFQNWTYLLMSA